MVVVPREAVELMAWSTSTRPSNTRQTRAMRARVLHEEPVCRTVGCGSPATEDDHIIGWSQREAAGMSIEQWHARPNHQGLCASCHATKTRAEAQASRAAKSRRRQPEAHPGSIASA